MAVKSAFDSEEMKRNDGTCQLSFLTPFCAARLV